MPLTNTNHNGRISRLEEHILPPERNEARERTDEHVAVTHWAGMAGGRAAELRRAYYAAHDDLLRFICRDDVCDRQIRDGALLPHFDFTPEQQREYDAIIQRADETWRELLALWVIAGSPRDRRLG